MKQHLKAIVWPRDQAGAKKRKIFRYVIVGMVVTDEPIIGFEGKNELLLNGPSLDLVPALQTIKRRKPKRVVGDATDVLLSLNDI